MADKYEATFYDGGLSDMYARLGKAIEKDRRRVRRGTALRNLFTTLCVTLMFTVCIVLLGWWGYIPAILGTTTAFTVRDIRRLSK